MKEISTLHLFGRRNTQITDHAQPQNSTGVPSDPLNGNKSDLLSENRSGRPTESHSTWFSSNDSDCLSVVVLLRISPVVSLRNKSCWLAENYSGYKPWLWLAEETRLSLAEDSWNWLAEDSGLRLAKDSGLWLIKDSWLCLVAETELWLAEVKGVKKNSLVIQILVAKSKNWPKINYYSVINNIPYWTYYK